MHLLSTDDCNYERKYSMSSSSLMPTWIPFISTSCSGNFGVRLEDYDKCLVDSELPGSRSHFLSRTQDDKLHLTIDSFKFHNEDRGELYITCHLIAVLANDAEAPNKACSFVKGRWRSADGNDYSCSHCQSHDKPSSAGKFGSRGFAKPVEPEPFQSSGLRTNTVWEKEARVGPIIVSPDKHNSGRVEELLPGLNKIRRPSLFGMQ